MGTDLGGIMGFYFALVGILSLRACLASLGVFWGPGGPIFLPFLFVISLFAVLEFDMFVPSLCEFYQILLNCESGQPAVAWVGLGLFFFFFFSSCNSPSAPVFSIAALSDWVAVFVIFCFMFFSFLIPLHASLGDRDAGPA